jgi:hypothetical protein
MISIFAILTNTIRYRYGIDASGIEAEPDLLKYSRRIISIMISSSFGDNPNGIYEYGIDNEIIKIGKALLKLAFRADGIS